MNASRFALPRALRLHALLDRFRGCRRAFDRFLGDLGGSLGRALYCFHALTRRIVDRFDANSYLYITKAMDYFDLTEGHYSLAAAFSGVKARFLVISFTSDWLYPSYQSLEVVRALRGRNCDVAYCELPSNYGHDAFLVAVNEQTELVRGFLSSTLKVGA